MDSAERETCEKNLAIIKEFYRAIDETGDWQASAHIFDFDNLVLYEADGMPYGGIWHGEAAFRRFNTMIYETWQPLQHKILEYTAGGDLVIVYLQMVGTGRTGLTYSMTICEPWRLKNGKVVEIRPHYFDTYRLRMIDGRLPM